MGSRKPRTQRDRVSNAIRGWMVALNGYPGWSEWVRKRVARTLYHDDELDPSRLQTEKEFIFPPELDKQHSVIYQYLGLQQTVEALKECEYYFRRYAFRGLPVSRANHMTNVCEMYFGRFYEFKERLKRYFEVVKAISPNHNLDIGKFIRQYEKIFDNELRERHYVHHHGRFQDVAIDRVFILGATGPRRSRVETTESLRQYRKLSKEWAHRVRRRGEKMDEVLEAVADATLRTCRFIAMYALAATIAEYRRTERPHVPRLHRDPATR